MIDYENIKVKGESTEVVLKVLTEYSDKLLDTFERYQKESRNYFFMFILFIILVVLTAVFGNTAFKQLVLNKPVDPFYLTGFLFSLSFGLATLFKITWVISFKQKTLRRNIVFLASQLKKAIKLASQLEDKSEPSSARRLELSLRLFEAEGVYDMVEPTLSSNIIASKPLRRFINLFFVQPRSYRKHQWEKIS